MTPKNHLLILFVSVLLIISCGQSSKENASKKEIKKTYGGHLRLSLSDNPVSIYPHEGVDVNSSDIIAQTYDGLVRYNANTLEIIPAIAERWEMSEDGKKYTFYLRKDAFFHDDPCFEGGKGKNIKAIDVEYSMSKACTQSEKNLIFSQTFKNQLVGADLYYRESVRADMSSKIEGIQILDEYTISFSLLKPNYEFLSILATPSLSIFPKEAIDKYGENSRVGSGAFKIVSGEDLKNEYILVRNERYYRKDSLGNALPFLDSISFYVSTSKRHEMDEFKKRNLEMVWGVPKESVDALVKGDLKKFGNDSIYRLKLIPEYTTQFYSFNLKTKIFQNENVRKAISAAIDKNKIVEEVLKGEAFASGTFGIIPPSMKYYEANKIKGIEFNPEQAKKWLAEAGYPDGKNFPALQLKINNDGRKSIPVAVEIAKQLERNLKIRINMDMVSLSEKLADEYQGKSDIYRSGWTADYPSPESFLNLFYGAQLPSDNEASFPNTSRFNDGEFNQKFEAAISEKDRTKRYALFVEAEQILINKAPIIPLYYEENYILVQSYIHDLYFNPLKYKDLSLVFFNK